MEPRDTPDLTDKTLAVLREMLEHPDLERTAKQIGNPIGMSDSAVSLHLARLIGARYVTDRRIGTRRVYRLRPEHLADACFAAGVRTVAVRRTRRTATPTARDNNGNEVWTLPQLREAVARGEQTQEFLDAVERSLRRAQQS